MDFDEFAAVYDAYITERDAAYRDEWCRMRTLACIVIQPHLGKGKKITPEKLLPLPWDKTTKVSRKADTPELTTEQRRARMAEIVKKLGDKI